jgi:hypothetical protein
MNDLSLNCKDQQKENETILTLAENNGYRTLQITVSKTNFQRENKMIMITHPAIILRN